MKENRVAFLSSETETSKVYSKTSENKHSLFSFLLAHTQLSAHIVGSCLRIERVLLIRHHLARTFSRDLPPSIVATLPKCEFPDCDYVVMKPVENLGICLCEDHWRLYQFLEKLEKLKFEK